MNPLLFVFFLLGLLPGEVCGGGALHALADALAGPEAEPVEVKERAE